jgi:hypothetical protein
VAPPAPPPGEGVQALPEELEAAAAADVSAAAAASVPALPGGPSRRGLATGGDLPAALAGMALLANLTAAGATGRRLWRSEGWRLF